MGCVAGYCNASYWWKLNEEHGKIKRWYGFGADGAFPEFVTNMQRQSMFDYSKNSYLLVIKLNIPADADGTHK
jgi:hypothetical protein